MARHKKIRTEEQDDPAMDISSMIDCCFLLLIYFLVATTLVSEKKLDIVIPGGESSSSTPSPLEPGSITVKNDGSIYWNSDLKVGEAFDTTAAVGTAAFTAQRHLDELVGSLKLLKDQATAVNETPIVMMSGGSKTPHQRIVDVMAALAEAGITTVGLNTSTEE